MSSIKILTEAVKAHRAAANAHEEKAAELEQQAKASRDLAALEVADAEKIEADIELLKNGSAETKPKVFAGRTKAEA